MAETDLTSLADILRPSDLEKSGDEWLLAIHDSRMSKDSHAKILEICEGLGSVSPDTIDIALPKGNQNSKEIEFLLEEISKNPELITELKSNSLHPIWLKIHRRAVDERKANNPEQYRLQLGVAQSRRKLETYFQSQGKTPEQKSYFLDLTSAVKKFMNSFNQMINMDNKQLSDAEIIQRMKELVNNPNSLTQSEASALEKGLQDTDLLPVLKTYIQAEFSLLAFHHRK